MAGEEIKQLESKIDTSKDGIITEQEVLVFLQKEENVKELGDALKTSITRSPEILEHFFDQFKKICEVLLTLPGLTIEQIDILLYYKTHFEQKDPITSEKINSFLSIKELDQDFDFQITKSLQNSINNLEDL